jgi:UDP-2,3-diacylglucosamine pyrophosphatase LpxH
MLCRLTKANKAALFTDFICEHESDLVALTETWFSDDVSASKTQYILGFLESIALSADQLLIVGDFNIHVGVL